MLELRGKLAQKYTSKSLNKQGQEVTYYNIKVNDEEQCVYMTIGVKEKTYNAYAEGEVIAIPVKVTARIDKAGKAFASISEV